MGRAYVLGCVYCSGEGVGMVIKIKTLDPIMHGLAQDVATAILEHATTLSGDGIGLDILLQDLQTLETQMEARNATRH